MTTVIVSHHFTRRRAERLAERIRQAQLVVNNYVDRDTRQRARQLLEHYGVWPYQRITIEPARERPYRYAVVATGPS